MTQWELETRYVEIVNANSSNTDARMVWTKKDAQTGLTNWEEFQKMAAAGWELVNITPIARSEGRTVGLLYTFKRPKE